MYMYVLALYYFMMIACDPVRGWGFYVYIINRSTCLSLDRAHRQGRYLPE